MNKTFKRTIACLLTVLMVVCSMPFTAFAAVHNRQWWVDDGVDPSTITSEPAFSGYNSVDYGYGYDYGAETSINEDDLRDEYKPVVAVIVSSQGTAGADKTDISNCVYNKYYGYNASMDYDTVKAAGNILNPAQLKAGQRIAVSVEFGGCDVIVNGQLLGKINLDYLKVAKYSKAVSVKNGDTWAAQTSTTGGILMNGSKYSAGAFSVPSQKMDPANGEFAVNLLGSVAATGGSTYIGDLTPDGEPGARAFGHYGTLIATFSFEVLQDCDLKDVFKITEDDPSTGTPGFMWTPYHPDTVDAESAKITTNPNGTKYTFAIAPIVWDSYEAGSAPETHEHNYVESSRTPATCTEDGKIVYTCDSTVGTCDAPTKEEVIPATGHTPVDVPEKAPTCTEAGLTAGTKCSVCGTTITAGTEIPALNHNYTSEITKAATCTEKGTETFTCTRCDDSYTKEIPATGHTEAEIPAVEATCTTAGSTAGVKCSVCDTVLVAPETIDALGHDFSIFVSSTAADCQTQGTTTYKCSRCDENDTQVGGYGPHTEVEIPAVDPTCTKVGYTAGVKCSVCNEVLTAPVEIPATGHAWDAGVVTTPATCTTAGVKTFTCANCNETKTEDIPATGHTEAEIPAVEATCTTPGSTAGVKCSVCDTVLVAPTEIPALGHVEKTTVTTVDATFDSEGSVTTVVTCERCGVELSRDVQVLPILKSYTVTVDAADMGTVTLDGTDVSEGAAVKVAPASKITLTAEAIDGAKFVGWTANGVTLVSTDAQFTTTVLANVTYTPVFEVANDSTFTVTFVDAFGNVVSVQTSDKEIVVPAAPARPGYAAATDNGWSMTNDEIKALTASATVTAQYVKAEDVLYTVTADGCQITANGETVDNTVSVPYDTKVTVTNTSATAWVVKDAVSGEEVTVAYGDSYTFFVTADITLTIATDAVVATPTVANVGVSTTGATGAVKAVFKATRTMADGCQFIDAGFVYGKGDLGAITLDNVDGKAVKAAYTKTASEQFSLTYGLSAQQGTMTAVAFVAYVDANGANQVVYADPMTYTY